MGYGLCNMGHRRHDGSYVVCDRERMHQGEHHDKVRDVRWERGTFPPLDEPGETHEQPKRAGEGCREVRWVFGKYAICSRYYGHEGEHRDGALDVSWSRVLPKTTTTPDNRTQSELAQAARDKHVKPGDWVNSLTSEQRKTVPLGQVLQHYWPDATALLAYHSYKGNEKHNPGEPLHWAREKSKDHEDCVARHLIGVGGRDADGLRHTAGLAWRALCMLQLEIERAYANGEEVF